MNRATARTILLAVLLLSLYASSIRAENLALNRPYTWSVAPNYTYCTDPGDAAQLTDGVYNPNSFDQYYTTTPTVGWTGSGPVCITIDLGQVYPIGKLTFRTTGGWTGYAHPAFIDTWVSDDGVTFSYGGELISGSWANGLPDQGRLRGEPFNVYQYAADGLQLRGRYVKFVPYRAGRFLFCDEIQVFRGSFDPNTVVPSSIQLTSGFETWSTTNKYDAIARVRMLYDLQELQKHSQAGAFTTQINALRQQVLSATRIDSLAMEQGLPYTSRHAEIWKLNGPMNRAAGLATYSLASAKPYEPLHPFDTFTADNTTTEMHMIVNEQRSAAFNVSNFSDSATAAHIGFEWSTPGFPLPNVDLKTLRFTEAQERFIAGAALSEAEKVPSGTWTVDLTAGVTGQLWLTFDSHNVSPGTYNAQLRVTPSGSSTLARSLRIIVHQGTLGTFPTLDSFSWDYAHLNGYPMVTAQNKLAILSTLKRHQAKSHWISPNAFVPANGSRNPDGTYSVVPTFSGLNLWLNDLAAAGDTYRYYIYLNLISYESVYSGGFTRGSPAYVTGVKSFFQALANVVQARGLDRSRFTFLVLDEPPYGSGWEQAAIDFISAANQAVPEFRFWTNPCWTATDQISDPYLQAHDAVVPGISFLSAYPSLFSWYQNWTTTNGREFGIYDTRGAGLTRSPTGYFRMLAWRAMQWGCVNIGAWSSAACSRTNSWDDFGAQENFEWLFCTPTTVTTGKHLTAWRDGIEDYEYGHLIKNLIAQGQAKGLPSSLLTWAQTTLDNTVATAINEVVADDGYWSRNVSLNDSFDRNRLQLLTVIDNLSTSLGLSSGFECRFESPLYTAGAGLVGVDGWSILNGTGFVAVITPHSSYPQVLDGGQSGFVYGSGSLCRAFGGVSTLTDGGQVALRFKLQNAASGFSLYVSNDMLGHTPCGFYAKYQNGTSRLWAFAKPADVNTGVVLDPSKVYQVGLVFDVAHQRYYLKVRNMTHGTAEQTFGPYLWWGTFTVAGFRDSGGIYLSSPTAGTYIDSLQVLPPEVDLTGFVELQDFSPAMLADVAVRIELIQGGIVVKTLRTLLEENGCFTVAVPPGQYDVGIKTYAHLRSILRNQDITANPSDIGLVTLTTGDSDNDNTITSSDLAILLAGMGATGDNP